MSKWPVSRLHGKLLVRHGYPFKSEYFSDAGHYIVLTPGNFYEEGGFKRQAGKEKFYLGEIPKDYLHKKGDLIVAMTEQAAGLLGSCAVVPDNDIYLHNQRLGLITTDSKQLDRSFVYYLFQTKSVREQIRLSSTGSKVKHTSPERIYAVTATLPEVGDQQKIAAVLSALDAKIDCNNRINAELEAMAKTLYDYWFVQFDFPDANGKPYKSSGGKMVYNATLKREIPAGWEAVRINELFQNRTDTISSTDVSGDMPYTPIDSLPMRKMSFGIAQSSGEANSSLIQYEENDILIGAMRVYFHRVCIAPFDGITRTTVIVLRPKKPNHLPYLYQVCNEDRTIEVASKISVGTQQPYVNWEDALENHTIPHPENDEPVERYSSMMLSVTKDVINRERENAELAKLRDWLLPLLMNGQVMVA
jgi:type I restriction enzyme, S subunit